MVIFRIGRVPSTYAVLRVRAKHVMASRRNVADVENPDVLEDVVFHVARAVGVRENDGRGRAEGAQLERQVRLSPRVDDERLLQSAEAVQHYERRRQSRLEGLRHRHADRLRSQVSSLRDKVKVPRSTGR